MARRTKKVGRTGRFGARYGLSVRRRLKAIEDVQFRTHRCPRCLTGRLKRPSTAIWACRKCGHKFAGGAYVPATGAQRREAGSAEVRLEVPVADEVPEVPEPVEAEVGAPEPDVAEPAEPGPVEADEEPEPEPVEADEEPEAEERPRHGVPDLEVGAAADEEE